MTIFSYHLTEISFLQGITLFLFGGKLKNIPGLIFSEKMTVMTLGSHIISPQRLLFGKIAFFAEWKDEASLENFLESHPFGKVLAKGWHVRLEFLRQWGSYKGIEIPKVEDKNISEDSVVVAVTIARMNFFQIPRFIYWGRPVEKLVRDHPGKTLALASMKLPNKVSTFSIWKSVKEMTNMVRGLSDVPSPKRHIDAMKERDKKDFHYEFTTLRFKPISESGQWLGKENLIFPKNQT